MTDQHAVYAPSSAHRWMVCTASAEAIAKIPEQEEGEAARDGTEAHEEIERCLGPLCVSNLDKDPMPYPLSEPVNPTHPAAHGVALVIDYVRQLIAGTPFGYGTLWIEQRVRLTDEIWGRCDVAHWDADAQVLTIVDYKNGFVDVQAEHNEQLQIYAAASIYTHNLPARWVRYVIVQPNSIVPGPRVKQWIESADDLYAFASRAAAVPTGSKSFVAGEQCKYCPLFGRCPASQDVLRNLGAALINTPADVPLAQRAIFKACEKPIADWFKSADKVWTKDALSGSVPPGMGLFTATTRRTWKDEAAARALILSRFGPDKLDPPTVAQAEKLGMTDEDMAPLVDKPAGGPVLAFESDKRAPWKTRSAAEMFAGVVGASP